ncbi:MAG: hypothetical protein COW42_06995, partial [Deltaproteobacteria bacterium CG17_big_fil_post_rev_8_21_14_2_50_63_7]
FGEGDVLRVEPPEIAAALAANQAVALELHVGVGMTGALAWADDLAPALEHVQPVGDHISDHEIAATVDAEVFVIIVALMAIRAFDSHVSLLERAHFRAVTLAHGGAAVQRRDEQVMGTSVG